MARRISWTSDCTLDSETNVSGHTRAWISAFDTALGRRSSRSSSSSHALRVRRTSPAGPEMPRVSASTRTEPNV